MALPPFPEDADVSVTTCQMLALCSARQAGISIPSVAIRRSVDFLRRCQNPDGGFRYRLIDPPESLLPRSAAAVVALHAVGLRDDPAVLHGRRYLANPLVPLRRRLPLRTLANTTSTAATMSRTRRGRPAARRGTGGIRLSARNCCYDKRRTGIGTIRTSATSMPRRWRS